MGSDDPAAANTTASTAQANTPAVEDGSKRPEVRLINRHVLLQTCVLMAVRGLGFIAITWSMVVLLGGSAMLLRRIDFWYLTTISLIQSARVFNAPVDKQYTYFVNRLFGERARQTAQSDGRQSHSSGLGELVPFVQMVPLPILVIGTIPLSAMRLVYQDYGLQDVISKANLRPAENIFYSLALFQGVIYIVWFVLNIWTEVLVRKVARECFDDNDEWVFDKNWGRKPVRKYLQATILKCSKDLSSIRHRNLIKFAAGLLDSEDEEDYISGAKMLVSFIDKDNLPVQVLIRSSRKKIEKLLMMLAWTEHGDREIRKLAARIVEHVAGDLSLAQFPGALQCISSLLEPSKQDAHALASKTISVDDDAQTQGVQEQDKDGSKQECPLIIQGLRILEKLSHDNDNCMDICRAEYLVTKIMAPIYSNTLIKGNDPNDQWLQILNCSYKVVARLVGVPGRNGKRLRTEIESKLKATVIVTYVSQPELQVQIIEMFTRFLLHEEEESDQSKWVEESAHHPTFAEIALMLFMTCRNMLREKNEKQEDTKGKEEERQESTEDTKEEPSPRMKALKIQDVTDKVDKAPAIPKGESLRGKALVTQPMTEEADKATAIPGDGESSRGKALVNGTSENSTEQFAQVVIEKAGRALATLSMASRKFCNDIFFANISGHLVNDLLTIIGSFKSIGYSIIAAEIMHNLCFHLGENFDRDTVLLRILELLVKFGERRNYVPSDNMSQLDLDKLEEILISIVAGIYVNENMEKESFEASVKMTFEPSNIFVERLKYTVEKNCNNVATADGLGIVKAIGELVLSMIRRKHDAYVRAIREHQILDSLTRASHKMSGLENWLRLIGTHDRGVKNSVWHTRLPDLVKEAKRMLQEYQFDQEGSNAQAETMVKNDQEGSSAQAGKEVKIDDDEGSRVQANIDAKVEQERSSAHAETKVIIDQEGSSALAETEVLNDNEEGSSAQAEIDAKKMLHLKN